MPISPHLSNLRAKLEASGMVVVEEPDYLTIRLPFFCSVRVHSDEGRLRFESYFGLAPRVRATTLKFGALLIASIVAGKFGVDLGVGMATVTVIAGAYDVIRWTITEQTVTRAALLNGLAPVPLTAVDDARLPSGTRHEALNAGTFGGAAGAGKDRARVPDRLDRA